MGDTIEYAVFGALMSFNFAAGLYFAFKKTRSVTTDEMFFGSRTLKMFPLAVSIFASVMSPIGLVAFTGHFYEYGFHFKWSTLTRVIVLPIATHVIIPVLYNLKVASIFEYIRMRYNSKISITACVINSVFLLSYGSVSIVSSSVTIATLFHVPFTLCCIITGAAGTLYTALGGLRGVVWTDSLQAVILMLAPATIVIKVTYDAHYDAVQLRPVGDFDVRPYVLEASLDLTKDENLWSCLIGLSAMALYGTGINPVVVQRYLAARSLKDARRLWKPAELTENVLGEKGEKTSVSWFPQSKMALMGILLALVFAIVQGLMTLALIFWYRDCDPFLSGTIKSLDQLVPFYVKQNLSRFPGFSGVFLAGIVCATTSTISSIINNLAANCYVDIVAQYVSLSEHQAIRITTCLAFAIGTLMTAYSCLIPYLGSAARIFMMICSAVTGPFVALFMMALVFPFVNCKGAGVATLLMIAFETCYMLEALRHGVLPPRMQATLNNCPGNTSVMTKAWNTSAIVFNQGSDDLSYRYRVSPYWSNFFSAIATVVLGLAISACTGGFKSCTKNIPFTSAAFLRLWQKIKIIRQDEITTVLSALGDDKFSEEQKPEEEVMLGREHETGI